MTDYEKRMTYIVLENSTEKLINILDNYVVDFNEWKNAYNLYVSITDLSNFAYNVLKVRLGKSLKKSNISFSSIMERASYMTFVENVREKLPLKLSK